MKHLISTLLFTLASTVAALAQYNNPCLKVTSPSGSNNLWERQAHYTLGSPMKIGKSYTLTVKIKASTPTEVSFWPLDEDSKNRNEWDQSSDVQFLEPVHVTDDWGEYTWKFTAEFKNTAFNFSFGKLFGEILFDDVVLIEDAVGVNMIVNGDFSERHFTGWKTLHYYNQSLSIVDGDNPMATHKALEIPAEYELAEQGDPNFWIFICYGQSNMEGAADIEEIDRQNVPERFQMMATVDYADGSRERGLWYTAEPPICRYGTGLSPVDYFGRTLCENLPDSIRIGVINVAVGGAKIELYFDEVKDDYINSQPDWFKNICKQYDNDPFMRLVEMGRLAEQSGTIKGFLLHQGESNNSQKDWGAKVMELHKRFCYFLGIRPEETPLLVGETLSKEMGGDCWLHNVDAIPRLPLLMPNAYIISSKGLKGNGKDPWHFSSEGYREFGKRYAEKYLELIKATK